MTSKLESEERIMYVPKRSKSLCKGYRNPLVLKNKNGNKDSRSKPLGAM